LLRGRCSVVHGLFEIFAKKKEGKKI